MKNNWHRVLAASLFIGCLCSCKAKPTPAGALQSSDSAMTVPDVGKVDTMFASATGYGPTPASATADAMKMAVLQVNGATIDTGSVSARFGLDVTDSQDSTSLRATTFAERVAERSGGAITNFKVKGIDAPAGNRGNYAVTIEANIAHFRPPADKKIRVVIAPIRFGSSRVIIGASSVSSQKVAEDIGQQIATALTESGRFSVLDRDSSADIAQELGMIEDGEAPRVESAKIGQAVTADVIWIGHLQSMAYNRNARKLETSSKELVGFSGGWTLSQKLVNVATRQIVLSSSVHGEAPGVAATTLGASINPDKVLSDMESAIAKAVVSSIVERTFPITIIERDGETVVLSQGGQSIRLGARYSIASLGKEMKDPQTGESLGRSSTPCCEVVVDRVAAKLSYGHLEKVAIPLEGLPLAALQVGEEIRFHAGASGEAPLVKTTNKRLKR